jgi:hypothetical protein
MHIIIVCLWLYYILIVQGDRCSFRRQPETTTPTTPIFPLGGFRPPPFQFAATDIPSSSTLPMFQPAFDATTEDLLGWDQMGYDDILATLDASQQAEEVVPSQLTQAPAGLSRHSQWAERPQRLAERHRRVERHWILQARRRRPWRHRLPTSSDRGWSGHLTPWTYDQDHNWAGARAVRPKSHRHI